MGPYTEETVSSDRSEDVLFVVGVALEGETPYFKEYE